MLRVTTDFDLLTTQTNPTSCSETPPNFVREQPCYNKHHTLTTAFISGKFSTTQCIYVAQVREAFAIYMSEDTQFLLGRCKI